MEADDIYELTKDDWRILGQPGYLFRKTLRKMKYFKDKDGIDNYHCDFCFTLFKLENGYLNEGFYESDKNIWICEKCYNDFKDMFMWTVVI